MRSLTVRDAMLIWLPLALLVALAAWFVAAFVEPAPPKRVVMSTGPLDGAYHAFALRYKAHLAEYGITLELKPSAGAAENIERLKSRQDGVTLALVQGGLANAENAPGLVTLGSMFYEPGWFFYRGGKESDLGNPLRGKRIAIGPSGSGTRAIGLQVMHHAGLAEPPTVLSELGGMAAAKALEAGEVDVVFYVAAADAPGVQRLLAAPGVRLLGAKRAEAFARRMPYLHRLKLPEGAADLARNVPPRDLDMLAVAANLVAVEEIHPVVIDLMLEGARKVHGGAGLFQRAGEFPAPLDLDLPLSPDAERFYRASPSLLRRYVPYWLVVWVNRFIVVGIPLLILAIPFVRYVPAVYRWSTRRRVYRWYGELKTIEDAVRRREGDAATHLARLERLADRVDRLHIPHAYAGELFALLLHIKLVRDMLREWAAK
ncbi:MAG: ABC transporter substrate-binding protein [Betaproteobacteria bacterium]|nr:ABC transporter substrate-binding protein [Betaproteobacteria bacterium]